MTKRRLVIATRESPLAMRQSEWVRDQLVARHPNLQVDFLALPRKAINDLDVALRNIAEKLVCERAGRSLVRWSRRYCRALHERCSHGIAGRFVYSRDLRTLKIRVMRLYPINFSL